MSSQAASLVIAKSGTHPVHRYELSNRIQGRRGGPGQKIVTREELAQKLEEVGAGKVVVFANGYFDVIHPGHLHLLHAAKELGQILVVGINSDRSTAANKGQGRPVLAAEDRMQILAAVEAVDFVTVFDELTPIGLIRQIRPQVLVKGGNYRPEEVVGKDIVEDYGGEVVVLPRWGGFTSSDIIRSIKHASDGMREE